jgi:hypothetical protein
LSGRPTPSPNGTCAAELLGGLAPARRPPFCQSCARWPPHRCRHEARGERPGGANNPRPRPLPLEPGPRHSTGAGAGSRPSTAGGSAVASSKTGAACGRRASAIWCWTSVVPCITAGCASHLGHRWLNRDKLSRESGPRRATFVGQKDYVRGSLHVWVSYIKFRSKIGYCFNKLSLCLCYLLSKYPLCLCRLLSEYTNL